MTKAEIRQECMKLSSSYTALDLFASQSFREMLQATINAVCETLGRVPVLTTICDLQSELTAMTDGLNITVNTQGPLIKDLPTYWEQYIANIGHVVHEAGHDLFTDFEHQNPLISAWTRDTVFHFYPEKPAGPDADLVENEMKTKPGLRKLYCNLMASIVNTIEDAYIERRLRDNFDGLAVAGIEKVNAELFRKADSLDVLLAECANGKVPLLVLAEDIMLARYVCGKELLVKRALTKEETELKEKIDKVLNDNEGLLKSLCTEQDGISRCKMFNRLFVNLFPLMHIPKEGSGEELGSPKSSSDISADTVFFIISAHNQSDIQKGKSQAPQGNTSSIKQTVNNDQEESSEDRALRGRSLSESSVSMQRELNKAIKDAILEKVLTEDEEEHSRNLADECFGISGGRGASPEFKGYCFARANPDKTEYEMIHRFTRVDAGNLTRKINNVLKERETESMEGGFLMGQHFNAKDVANHDGKYFSRQIIPDGRAEVAFSLVVDQSGSMGGDRIETAKRVTVLLEETLRNLGIPLMVTGHSEHDGKCRIVSFVDFDTKDGKDAYRIASMYAGGCNIDGAAITYAGEKLLKRPEKIKVMIVISDGQPTGKSFYSHTSNDDDTRLAVDYYRKKGIVIFGAVIDNFENIEGLYGAKYCFDCTNSGELEKRLVQLIKRYVLLKN